MKNFLVFGSTGLLGSAICKELEKNSFVSRVDRSNISILENQEKFDGVIWAQGLNFNDSIKEFNVEKYRQTLDVNVTYILETCAILIKNQKINIGANLVIVGSVWTQVGRPNKLSYSISKSALTGLVRSFSIDLAADQIKVNLVSPGPVDSPMTNRNLSQEDLNRIISENPNKKLVTTEEVIETICTLVTGKLPGVTGAEIIVDNGWTVSKLV